MNRYVVFGGDYYYPCGGWSDFRSSWERPEDACAEAERLVAHEEVTVGSYTFNRSECDWVHVIDVETFIQIYDAAKEGR
jgi:hypothetical protein